MSGSYPTMRVLGLMSGTSLDGMDLVLARFFEANDGAPGFELLDYEEKPWPEVFRARLVAAAEDRPLPASEFAALHHDLARLFAEFVRERWTDGIPADLAAFPGQTLHHAPQFGYGLQLGNPAVFATLTGLPTVGDFRSPDLALGGQGAPLVPMADALLRRHPDESRGLVNIGGIANLTLLPPGRGEEGVRAWDTGPGNLLLDRAARLALDAPFDEGGHSAARGRVHETLLASWLEHPYFAESPPKSTGRETFGGAFLGDEDLRHLAEEMGAESLLATLAELTVEPLARALEAGGVEAVYLSGGGARNLHLKRRLSERLPVLRVEDIEVLGCPAGAKEALDFAFLAYLSRLGRPVSLCGVTGAQRNAPAGALAPAPPSEE